MSRCILCYGDSNTYGYDPRSYLGERYPKSIRWTGLLEERGWKICNRGENGLSIPRSDMEIKTAVQMLCRTESDILTIMLGSNDLLQMARPSAKECSERMELFLTALLRADGMENPRKVLLVAPPPMALGAWAHDQETIAASSQLARCYKDTARLLNIRFADAGDWKIDLTFDGVHFSEAGHLSFAKGIEKALLELIAN